MTEPKAAYLIRKGGAFYRPNERGYTTSAIQAGRYTLEDATRITHPNGTDGPRDGMHFIHEDDIRCDDWAAYQSLTAERDDLAVENARLRQALRCVREEICTGPVGDVLWHSEYPSETTVDFICNTLGDDWDYDEWLARDAIRRAEEREE